MKSAPNSLLPDKSQHRHVIWLGVFGGALLFIIGVRFMIVPDSALHTFGLSAAPENSKGVHYVIGLRDLWLGALAVAFALLKDWRALGLWFLMGSLVCWSDAAIVAANDGPGLAVAFHTASGVFCLALGLGAWRRRPKD
ncbi:MAG: DUF4267 domain-containing protein [Alphaproteobacteria bacterium]|nr:DUF4267 domain-containing protein [Alphaproteobacteria bacterium]